MVPAFKSKNWSEMELAAPTLLGSGVHVNVPEQQHPRTVHTRGGSPAKTRRGRKGTQLGSPARVLASPLLCTCPVRLEKIKSSDNVVSSSGISTKSHPRGTRGTIPRFLLQGSQDPLHTEARGRGLRKPCPTQQRTRPQTSLGQRREVLLLLTASQLSHRGGLAAPACPCQGRGTCGEEMNNKHFP